MICLILLTVLVILISSHCKRETDKTVPTYFSRKDKNGKLIDATDMQWTWPKINTGYSRSAVAESNQTSKLVVKPAIVKDGHEVIIAWSGVKHPATEDFIALYCPESDKNNDYIDYFTVEVSPTYKEGKGKYSVRLTNLRTNCQFRYFRNITKDHQELLAISNIVIFEGGPEMPLQIHLALTGDPTQMRVMWVSGSADETPIVQFGMDQGLLKSTAEGKSQTYTASDFCSNQGKFIDPGFIHDVLITNLKPSTTYYYSCGVHAHMSSVTTFKTAPQVGSDVSFKFIAYSDMGLSDAAQTTAKYVLKDVQDAGYEFIFHNGDISYARGFEYIWNQWHSLIQPLSSVVPYMIGIGNHEQDHIDNSKGKDPSGVTGCGFHPWWGTFDDDSHGECGVPMFHRFHMPDNGNYLWWYSYDYGIVHFIMMSTEHEMGEGSRQYTWLENDLKNVDRKKTPWVILGGHRPMYTSQIVPGDFIVALGFQILFQDLLYKYSVDLALWGHYHSYERTCAVYRNVCKNDGIVHIVIGTAGREEDWPPYLPPPWSLYRRNVDPYGYGRVTIANRSALHWEYFVNSGGKVVDDVWLIKD